MRKILFSLLFIYTLVSSAFGATIVFNTTDGNWGDGTKWIGGVKPANGDDVVFNAASGNCSLNEITANLNSLNMTGYAKTLADAFSGLALFINSTSNSESYFGGTVNLNQGGASGTSMGIRAMDGVTAKIYWNGAITNITNNIVTNNVASAVNGTIVFMDNSTVKGTLIHNYGYLRTDGLNNNSNLTHTWGSFNSSNTNVRSINLGNSTINITSGTGAWSFSTPTNLTFDAGSSTINFLGAGTAFNGGGQTFNNVNFFGSGNTQIAGTTAIVTYGNFTKIPTTSNADQITLSNSFNVTNILNISGYNASKPLLFRASSLGSQKNITANTLIADYVDFKDINFNQTFNLASNSSGDCGGNSNITFTPSQDQHWICADGGNWDNASCWSGRVPLPQDDSYFDCAFNASKTVATSTFPRLGRTIDWTGATGSPTFGTGAAVTNFGGLTLISGMTFTPGANSWTFEGRDNYTLIMAGKTFSDDATFSTYNGKISQGDGTSYGGDFFQTAGEYDLNDFNFYAGISSSVDLDSTAGAHTFRMGNGRITIDSPTNLWLANSSVLNLIAENSTLIFRRNTTGGKLFDGGDKIYNDIIFSGGTGSSGVFSIKGNNTFNNFTILNNNTPTIAFERGKNQNISIFSAIGNETAPIYIGSNLTGTKANLTDINGGRNVLEFCFINDTAAIPNGARWWAFTNDTLVNSTGFITSNPTVTFTNMTLRNITFN